MAGKFLRTIIGVGVDLLASLDSPLIRVIVFRKPAVIEIVYLLYGILG
jgi:hypothetical protein